MIKDLSLRQVSLADDWGLQFAPRLNVLTGDNGLGKTLALDAAWWALTNTWSRRPIRPRRGVPAASMINFTLASPKGALQACRFDPRLWKWLRPGGAPYSNGLILYFQSDGSAAVYDPARNPSWDGQPDSAVTLDEMDPATDPPPAYRFRPDQILNGYAGPSKSYSNGLVSDWVLWQLKENPSFKALERALQTLCQGEDVAMGEPARLEPTDARDYPTIRIGGGESVPVPYASAGILRVLSMAYMIIWSWHEHLAASSIKGQPLADRLVVLWDEVESHLHPNWQRRIMPSFLSALNGLMGPQVETQLLLATHSPLVTASLEAIFDPQQDKIFRFDLVAGELVIEEQTVEKRGASDVWLEDLFETPSRDGFA